MKTQLKPLLQSLLIASGAIALSACGGGGSSTGADSESSAPDTSTSSTINGFVVDPAVESSVVKICRIDLASECLAEKTLTNALGAFSLTLSGQIDLSEYAIYATGGSDSATGEDLTGVQFSVPAGLQDTANNRYFVTPLTSLVTQRMNAGDSLQQAQTAISAELNIDPSDLTQSTESSAALLHKAMLLTLIAKNLDNGFADLTLNETDDQTGINAVIENSGLSNELINQLLALSANLGSASNTQDTINRFISQHTLLQSDLFAGHDFADATVIANADKLTDAILVYLSGQSVGQVNRTQIALLLGLMQNAATLDVTDAEMQVPDISSEVAEIALNQVENENLLNHRQELAQALEDSSEAKREYYYQSTASHLAQSADIISGVTDIATMESVYLNLAKGYLSNDNPALALQYANRNIFTPESEYQILLDIAEYYIDNDLSAEDAEAMLDKSLVLFKSYLQSKGAASIKSADVVDVNQMVYAFSQLGLNDKAQALTAYMQSLVSEFGDNSTPFGAYAGGLTNAAILYAQDGDLTTARQTLEDAYTIAQQTPPNQKSNYPDTPSRWYYLMRVFAMFGVAEAYYQNLGSAEDKARALQIFNDIYALRADDGIEGNTGSNDTTYRTDIYLSNFMMPILADAGTSLADVTTIIDSMVRDTYIANAWANYAVYNPTLSTGDAIELIQENLMPGTATTEYRNAVKSLTYSGVSKSTPYLALNLINNGQLADAKLAIDTARTLLDQAVANSTETTDALKTTNYVLYGYAKLANLYHFAGESELSAQMMQQAIDIITGDESAPANAVVFDPYQQAYGLTYIARHYFEMGMNEQAFEYAEQARQFALTITDAGERRSRLATLATIINDNGSVAMSIMSTILEDIYDIIAGSEMLDSDSVQEDYQARAVALYGTAPRNDSTLYFSGGLQGFYLENNQPEGVQKSADLLLETAAQIADTSNQLKAYQGAIWGYATINQIDSALQLANQYLPLKANYLQSLRQISYSLYQHDAFESCDVATVDNDRDGLPDFYDQGATAEQIAACGLTLDSDVDNDGIPDSSDLTPFFNSTAE
ncbi:EF-hand domain-containing protein [uncultured Thiomicrorhabdus sp.]